VAGEHTRAIQIATPTIGGLMKFAVKTVTCLGCRTPLKSGKGMSDIISREKADQVESAVCVNCRSKLPELYQKQVSSFHFVEDELTSRWSRLHHSRSISPGSGLNVRDVRDHYIRMLFVLLPIVLFSTEGQLGRKRLLLLLLNSIGSRRRLHGRE
jgi:hypothetical protein